MDGRVTSALRSTLGTFTEATGLWVSVVDADGRPQWSSQGAAPAFCRLVRSSGRAIARCWASYGVAGAQALAAGQGHIFRCHAGLTLIAVAVVSEDAHLGTITCGPVLQTLPGDVFRADLGNLAVDLGLDLDGLLRAAGDLEVVPGQRLRAAARLLLGLVTGVVEEKGREPAGQALPGGVPAVVEKVVAYLRRNYQREVTLEEIARAVHFSPYYLSHAFKSAVGCTIIEYLTGLRVERAKALLQDPCYTVSEVVQEIGYSEPSYFTKVFKRREGLTPTQYRRKISSSL